VSRTAFLLIVWQCAVAWVAALLVRLVGTALGMG
jgi:hypothetical protein